MQDSLWVTLKSKVCAKTRLKTISSIDVSGILARVQLIAFELNGFLKQMKGVKQHPFISLATINTADISITRYFGDRNLCLCADDW